ncbi:TonB-dependent receptor [Limisalsivibrio acetivorans]|uniref:TonB-dependent receptor n=1 Tax=Limisalsivibrio acetivorans TaxID=1304888 RepID=UPI0003B31B25|nr:TonB-dependent receptor [Limisalsivibrio acetivorans]
MLVIPVGTATGRDRSYTLEEYVVTAGRTGSYAENIPSAASVITPDNIAESGAVSAGELIAMYTGATVRSLGSGTVIDLRGMGDTAASSVVILVDGVRINHADMSGADLKSIPVEDIERVEILKSSGQTSYGNGAVGGVVNIITKESSKSSLSGEYGSYDEKSAAFITGGESDGFIFKFLAKSYQTGGFRDNGWEKHKTGSASFTFEPDYTLTYGARLSFTDSSYGLPGGVSIDDLDGDRDSAGRPDDYGDTSNERALFHVEKFIGEYQINAKAGFAKRHSPFVMGYSPLLPIDEQRGLTEEDTADLSLVLTTEREVFGRTTEISAGGDIFMSDYVRSDPSSGSRHNSNTRSGGVFISAESEIAPGTLLTAGIRYSIHSGIYREDSHKSFSGEKIWINGEEHRRENSEYSWELGAVHDMGDYNLFASFARSFRMPNTDEYAKAAEELKPQTGLHADAGIRYSANDTNLSASLFAIVIDDELYYGEDESGEPLNRNYGDKTMRKGAEISASKSFAQLRLKGTYTYTDAKFKNSGRQIPLVPEHKATAVLKYSLGEGLLLGADAVYVSSRLDGNDTGSRDYAGLDAYGVFGLNISYKYKNIRLTASADNIFDEGYESAAYSETYYPMPGRTFRAGAEVEF